MKEISINKLAYSKLFLHLAKYPQLSCNGILLSKTTKNQSVQFVDCVPLFHSSFTLAPAFEIALSQIDSFCQQNGLEISGFYHAFDNNNQMEPNLICYKLAEKLRENSDVSLCFLIDNSKTNPSNRQPCFNIYNFGDDQKLKKISCNVKLEDGTYETCERLLEENKFNLIYDFDNHLDDIKKDWRNLAINDKINLVETLLSN